MMMLARPFCTSGWTNQPLLATQPEEKEGLRDRDAYHLMHVLCLCVTMALAREGSGRPTATLDGRLIDVRLRQAKKKVKWCRSHIHTHIHS